MPGHILVINPNSSATVTAGIDAAVEPLRLPGGPTIECLTLAEGPPGIETQADIEAVVLPLAGVVQARADANACVIACFSDPGLQLCRERSGKPVFGIAEAGMLVALVRGERFGLLSTLERSIPRHLRYVRQLGLWQRFAGDRAIGTGVAGLARDDAAILGRMTDVGQRLVRDDGADVLVLACAGMARFREPLAETLGVAVVEPTQAAVTLALGAVRLSAGAAIAPD